MNIQTLTLGPLATNCYLVRADESSRAVIIDPATTHELEQMFERDKADSFLLTPQTWNTFRTPWKKFVGWFAHLLTPFL